MVHLSLLVVAGGGGGASGRYNEMMDKQEQGEHPVEDSTLLKSVPAERQVNRDSVIASLLVTMEGWGQAGWDRIVGELVLNAGRW